MNHNGSILLVILVALISQTFDLNVLAAQTVLELRPAQYEIRLNRTVMVTMRDGIRLATDLYFAVTPRAKVPC